jgi:hypothetical protein
MSLDNDHTSLASLSFFSGVVVVFSIDAECDDEQQYSKRAGAAEQEEQVPPHEII